MPERNNPDILFELLMGITALLVLSLVAYGLYLFLAKFSAELRYLNCEIARSYGAERKYWIRRRRKLWLSLIPFVKY